MCSFIINGSVDYKPNVKLHITGNTSFERIVGNNTGTVIIDSDNDTEITNMVVKKANYKESVNINEGLFEVKAGGNLKINHPYFKLKFVSKTN